MRRIALGLALVAGLSLSVQAQDVGDRGIEAVIRGQMDAFIADDLDGAFDFASPGIRRIFGDAQRFGGMVRQGYPMVYRPADVRFLELTERGGSQLQKVMVRDDAGAFHVLEYEMQPGADGGWVIDGVRLLEAAQLGA